MKWHAWTWAGVCVVGMAAGHALGQQAPPPPTPLALPSSAPPAPIPLGMPVESAPDASQVKTGTADVANPMVAPIQQNWPDLRDRGPYRSTYLMGNVTSPVHAISTLTTATVSVGTGPKGTNSFVNVLTTPSATAWILPGLLTTMNAESARPIDRVFVGYGYDFHVRQYNSALTNMHTGFNLNRFDLGVEKTFFDGRASAYIRVPYLSTTDNTTSQAINGFGDISGGVKYVLCADIETGSVLTTGFTVTAPTADDLVVTTNKYSVTSPVVDPMLARGSLPRSKVLQSSSTNLQTFQTRTFNPTFFQPYLTGTWVCDRWFVSNYVGLVLPSDMHVSTFINDDFAVGWQVYTNPHGCVRFVTPTLDLQFIAPLNYLGTQAPARPFAPAETSPTRLLPPPVSTINSSAQVFVGMGFQLGLWNRTIFSSSVIVPAAGPKAIGVGFTAGLNFLY